MISAHTFVLLVLISFQNFILISCQEDIESDVCVAKPKSERTLMLLKPDALKRGLAGESIKRIENGCPNICKLLAMKLVWPNETQVKIHYTDMENEIWFNEMVSFMTSGPVIPMVWEGENMVAVGREHLHAIREDYATTRVVVGHLLNIIHGADTVEAAKREMRLWFTEQELIDMEKESPTTKQFWPIENECLLKPKNNVSN